MSIFCKKSRIFLQNKLINKNSGNGTQRHNPNRIGFKAAQQYH